MTEDVRKSAEKVIRDVNQRWLYPDTIQLTILTESGAAGDDIFDIPSNIQSGVYTLRGQWESQIADRYRRELGGAISDATCYFLTDIKHITNLKNSTAYITKNGSIYKISEIIQGVGSDEIIVVVNKEND